MLKVTPQSVKTIVIGWIAYLIVSQWLIVSSFDASQLEAVPLFGNSRVMIVYCLASLPLGFVLSAQTIRLQNIRTCCGLVCLALITITLMPLISQLLAQSGASYWERSVLRSCVALVWCCPLASWLFVCVNQPLHARQSTRFKQHLLLAGGAAVLLPAVYVQAQHSKLEQSYLAISGKGRVASELAVLNQVWELVGDQPMAGQRLRLQLRQLQRKFRELATATARPLPESATANDVQLRAMQLLSLDRADEAEQLLSTFVDSSRQMNSDERLALRTLQAVAARESKQWTRVLQITDELLSQRPGDNLAMELQAHAYGGLGRPADAIAVYERLLDGAGEDGQLTSESAAQQKAMTHLQLAKLWMDCGNGPQALHHCSEAQRYDKSTTVQAEGLARTVLQHSCRPGR